MIYIKFVLSLLVAFYSQQAFSQFEDPTDATEQCYCRNKCRDDETAKADSIAEAQGCTGNKELCCKAVDNDFESLSGNVGGCRWRGRSPFCGGTCKKNETEVFRSKDDPGSPDGFAKDCLTGTKAYCCTVDGSEPKKNVIRWWVWLTIGVVVVIGLVVLGIFFPR